MKELNVDIGDEVKEGQPLAVIDVPETARRRQRQDAIVRQYEAEQRRAQQELAVAAAEVDSYRAQVDVARSQIDKAAAAEEGARLELARTESLVRDQAAIDRLLEEAKKRFDTAQAERRSTEAMVTAAEAELALRMAKSEAAAAAIDVAAAQTEAARSQLAELDELIKYATLKAPFDGVVIARNVDPGDLIRDAQSGDSRQAAPLFVVAQLEKVRVRIPLPEREAPFADVGDEVRVRFAALGGEELGGSISRRAPALDDATRTMLVEVDLDNPGKKLLPGMFGEATVILQPGGDRVVLPVRAVRYDEAGNSSVYVLDEEERVTIVPVAAGLDDGQRVEIIDGLRGGERVVGPSIHRLKPGQRVQVVSP